jgi:hypothetical protein
MQTRGSTPWTPVEYTISPNSSGQIVLVDSAPFSSDFDGPGLRGGSCRALDHALDKKSAWADVPFPPNFRGDARAWAADMGAHVSGNGR